MRIFVVIATYNAARWLQPCLDSLRQSSLPVQVLAVDNHSTDNTVETITAEYPEVMLTKLSANLGFGRANNIGLRYALENGADYVFLLNQDARLLPDTLQILIAIAERNPSFHVLSPLHLTGSLDALDHSFSRYASPDYCEGLFSDLALRRQSLRDGYETRFVNAALWLLPRACLEQVGGFDPLFTHYGEDYDFIHRVRYFNHKVVICPAALGVHDRDQQPFDLASIRDPQRRYHRTLVNMLISLKDVNRSFPRIFLRECVVLVRKLLRSALRFDGQNLWMAVKLLAFAFSRVGAIIRSRRICREPGAANGWFL